MPIDVKKLRAQLARQKRPVRGIEAPAHLEAQYRRALVDLVREMGTWVLSFARHAGIVRDSNIADFDRAFYAKFGSRFKAFSEEYPVKWAGQNSEWHKQAFKSAVENGIGVNLQSILNAPSDRVGRVVKASVKWNSDLIVSLQDEYKQTARDVIHDVFLNGDESGTLRSRLEQIEGVTESRAKLIARDQTQKLCSDLNQARQRDVGVSHYIWRGIDDGRERDSHIANNDQRFSWESPPEETGHPGEDIQCRCVADPDLSGLIENLANLD